MIRTNDYDSYEEYFQMAVRDAARKGEPALHWYDLERIVAWFTENTRAEIYTNDGDTHFDFAPGDGFYD